ncbi:Hypothetical protein NTJ_04455 [Nesidiocoris tenuis]|uniref:Uncharacterized protein n=1 Tax=Nesidiocoris tenuis TaxID=355587 RepID=A0ABN7AHA5_9HEMI|nr:Hypothetical protein NTJ_04455 [Nesidiocoris tenuis]
MIVSSMSEIEREMGQILVLIETIGKRGVRILLTPVVAKGMNILYAMRDDVGKQPIRFRQNGETIYTARAPDALHYLVNDAQQLTKPYVLKSTKYAEIC